MANSQFLLILPAILHALSGGSGGGGPAPQPEPPVEPPVGFTESHVGHATYYTTADGSGNCMFDPLPEPQFVGALNNVDYITPTINGKSYANATLCGAYARVTGRKGSVVIKIVDRCPDAICTKGHIDLSPEAFAEIDDLREGFVDITWKLVSQPLDGPVRFRYKDGSSQWWTAVQVLNHRNPVASVEVRQGSTWKPLERTMYNYFLEENGLGQGYHTFRITDVFGNQLIETSTVDLDAYTAELQEWRGNGQFPTPD